MSFVLMVFVWKGYSKRLKIWGPRHSRLGSRVFLQFSCKGVLRMPRLAFPRRISNIIDHFLIQTHVFEH